MGKPAAKLAVKKSKRKIKIGLYGGSFNPIHYGHLNTIETIHRLKVVKEIWLMPNDHSPLKPQVPGPNAEKKTKMLEIGLSTLATNGINCRILDIELNKSVPSYTIDSLEALGKKHKDADFSLIIGMDQFDAFDKWKNFKKILKTANLIVTSRSGYNLPKAKENLPEWLKGLAKRMTKNKVSLTTGKEVLFVQLNDVVVSATEIRRKIRREENVTHLTPGPVTEYLKEQKVYDASEALVADYKEFARFCAKIISDKGGIAVNAYDVRELVQPSEFTIVASGTSQRHTRALGEYVAKEAKQKYGIHPQNIEGSEEGRWVVVDYGPLIIHLFYDFVRNEYRIEDLWAKAGRISQ